MPDLSGPLCDMASLRRVSSGSETLAEEENAKIPAMPHI